MPAKGVRKKGNSGAAPGAAPAAVDAPASTDERGGILACVPAKRGAPPRRAHALSQRDGRENPAVEAAIREAIGQFREATDADRRDAELVLLGFRDHMQQLPKPLKESSMISYVQAVKRVFSRDGRSFVCVADEQYALLIKQSFMNREAHGVYSAALAKFKQFYEAHAQEAGGDFVVDPKWADLRKEQSFKECEVDERGFRLRHEKDRGGKNGRFAGVLWLAASKRWHAMHKGKLLGSFLTEEKAAEAIWCSERGRSVHAAGMRSLTALWGPLQVSAPEASTPGPSGAEPSATARQPLADDDIMQAAQTVPIVDPLSMCRIETPVRGSNCEHIETFDRDTYLQFNQIQAWSRLSKRWLCPICSKFAHPESLAVAKEFQDILEAARNLPDVTHVSALPNGRLALLEGAEAGAGAGADGSGAGDSSDSDTEAAVPPPEAPGTAKQVFAARTPLLGGRPRSAGPERTPSKVRNVRRRSAAQAGSIANFCRPKGSAAAAAANEA